MRPSPHPFGPIEALEPRRLLSMTLLGDFNTTTAPSYPHGLVSLGATGYFVASDTEHGRELWMTDGTPRGTKLFMDLHPGTASSIHSPLSKVGNRIFFQADDGQGSALWTTDGTFAGTIRLTDAAYAYNQIVSGGIVDLNGMAFLGGVQSGVWRSDGTVAGTTQISALEAGSVARLGDNLYFHGRPLGGGTVALWRSDGTAAGTMVVRELATPYVLNMSAALDGRLYFWASEGADTGVEPWSSDGTAAGTVPLGDLAAGPTSSAGTYFAAFNEAVYFIASTRPHYEGLKLFRTDGTAGSATVIADIGLNSLTSDAPGMAVYNDAMYFQGRRPGGNPELWTSDGTPEGTGEFIDLNPGVPGSRPAGFIIYDDRLYFRAQTANEGTEIFSTDGTVKGTRLLKDIAPGSRGSQAFPTTPAVFNGRLWFRADDALHGTELWSTDGTADGTALLKDINTRTNDFNPSSFTPGPGGFHYFTANDGVRGTMLWKTDGTAAGTTAVKSFLVIPPWYIGPFTYVNNLLLFGARDFGGAGYELWRSDGTEAGTYVVKDIAPGSADSLGSALIPVGDRVFFRATETQFPSRYGLWVSDGTEDGTRLVRPSDNVFALEPFSGHEYNGKLIFHASSYGAPEWAEASLFISDGTLEGTRPFKGGFRNTGAANWTLFNKIYFTATTIEHGTELWTTDGTTDGTRMLADINPGAGSSSPDNLVATADVLVFAASDPVHGRELWRIDASTRAPVRLTNLSSNIAQVKRGARNDVLFTTVAGELYRFDGSNIIPLPTRGFTAVPTLLGSDANFTYFAARTDAAGTELWRTAGTPAGTVIVRDLVPGPDGSFPESFSLINAKTFVSARVPAVGRELFVVSPFSSGADASPALVLAPATRRLTERIIDLIDE